MKENEVYAELSSIRSLMERSAKFISLSGLSGIMAGIYALGGAWAGYRLVYDNSGSLQYRSQYVNNPNVLWQLFFIAVVVLLLSIVTCIWLTVRQARKKGENVWNPVSKRLLTNLCIPLVTGGLFIFIAILHQNYGIISSACLIFYGLALISGSHYTFSDIKWLGLCEVALGLLAALLPGYGIVFWVAGFGILHIVYGLVMHFKYKQ
ncbi:hypothetical protein FW774_07300 [Pedobacter sp. BS3]|uniref:hypothetical protein n=1 Tax=Pedobacter sp. BS3 TaxID=2567937 RepID=UPI0011F066AA|nr:hypothetical protein [Pedobacter sp. BS3]TZF84778.1 hypothetical protein FW774_07300 [Pedobacter sp. BS3]